jgi:hypothetical protein
MPEKQKRYEEGSEAFQKGIQRYTVEREAIYTRLPVLRGQSRADHRVVL